jgi:hypothetical protein
MAEYYTTISKKQVDVLRFAKDHYIRISQNMLNYLYALARQGSCFARDPSVEDFRKTISGCVGEILKKRDDGTPEEFREIEKEINRAFRQICAIKTNKYLKEVRKELDYKPA